MLLVDDGQGQRAELDLFLDQRMRPHDQMDVAALDRRQQRATLGRRDPAAQQRHAISRRREAS